MFDFRLHEQGHGMLFPKLKFLMDDLLAPDFFADRDGSVEHEGYVGQ